MKRWPVIAAMSPRIACASARVGKEAWVPRRVTQIAAARLAASMARWEGGTRRQRRAHGAAEAVPRTGGVDRGDRFGRPRAAPLGGQPANAFRPERDHRSSCAGGNKPLERVFRHSGASEGLGLDAVHDGHVAERPKLLCRPAYRRRVQQRPDAGFASRSERCPRGRKGEVALHHQPVARNRSSSAPAASSGVTESAASAVETMVFSPSGAT